MSDYFPPELIPQILLKLPVKSLVRFTTVSKCWRSIITSPSFISSHLHNPRKQTLLILSRYGEHGHYSLLQVSEHKPFSIDSSSELQFPFRKPRIVGSCRGIVCLSVEADFFARRSPSIVLYNPSVRKHVVLPKATINPRNPPFIVLGFGFADHGFIVVRLVISFGQRRDDGSRSRAEVFSLRTGRWRRLGTDGWVQNVTLAGNPVFLNGVVHWVVYHKVDGYSILVLRVAQEVFDEMKLPNNELVLGDGIIISLTLIGESLALIISERDHLGNKSCDVWLMKEYGVESSWTRLYSFSLVEGMGNVVALTKNCEALVASQGMGLVSYDLENLEIKDLGIQGRTNSFQVDSYVESLELF